MLPRLILRRPAAVFVGCCALSGGLVVLAHSAPPKRYVPIQAASKTASKTASNYPTFERDVAPFLQKYCVDCHAGNPNDAPANLVLDTFPSAVSVLKNPKVWDAVTRNVQSFHMPPRKETQPSPAEREKLVHWIESTFSQANCTVPEAGRVTLRRLNRTQYDNSVRDLLGVDFQASADFPSDDVGYGFDNIGDVLSISPLLMEKYLDAAEVISQRAIIAPDGASRDLVFSGDQLSGGSPFEPLQARALNSSSDEISAKFDSAQSGQFTIRLKAGGQQAGPDPIQIALRVDGAELSKFSVPQPEGKFGTFEAKIELAAGQHQVAVAFLNDFYDVTVTPSDRNFLLQSIEVVGPVMLHPTLPPSHSKLIPRLITPQMSVKQTDAIARPSLHRLARRAFRRPPTKLEIDRLMRCVHLAQDNGDSFERGMQLAIQAVLVSPYFLFRVEADPPSVKNAKVRALSDHELATRLSFFLWSSTPDDSLGWWADQNALHQPVNLKHQVKRMLSDPRAASLSTDFALQWLQLRKLSEVSPTAAKFPAFNDDLRAAMQTETTLFCEEIRQKDRSVLDFLDGNFSYLNGPLAKLYGVAGVSGDRFVRVRFSGAQAAQRSGVLTQASVLTTTSNPTRTSPVKRGKWVLEQILGISPPAPPPGVPPLAEEKGDATTMTLRQRMEQHRADPNCASCHSRMDPIGLGLENYDAVGQWRAKDGTLALDISGELDGGTRFSSPSQLKTILKGRKDEFVRALSSKMLIYALGRGLTPADKCAVDVIVKRVAAQNYRYSALILAVVESEPFLKRRPEGLG